MKPIQSLRGPKSKRALLGDYCEALALAAYRADGIPVAIPFGGRERSDLVIRVDNKWLGVQVKAARAKPNGDIMCAFSGGSGKKNRHYYLAEDFDLLLAVLPETGRIWSIPMVDIEPGTVSITLEDRYIWKPGVQDLAIEFSGVPQSEQVYFARRDNAKPRLWQVIKDVDFSGIPPMNIRKESWEMAKLFSTGVSYTEVGKKFGLTRVSVIERIERVVKRLSEVGVVNLGDQSVFTKI